jgi:hypothetical protein
LSNRLDISSLADINKLERVLHLNHQRAMLEKMRSEEVLQDEQFLIQRVLGFGPVRLLNSLFPHSHKLPLFELLKEAQFLYMVVGVTLNQPLPKRNELYWSVVFVQR